jgi:hypothetical protein
LITLSLREITGHLRLAALHNQHVAGVEDVLPIADLPMHEDLPRGETDERMLVENETTSTQYLINSAVCYPQQHPDFPFGFAPAGVDRNFCLQWSLQK